MKVVLENGLAAWSFSSSQFLQTAANNVKKSLVIKYAHNTYDGRTQNIPLEDTIFLLPEEKANSCLRDSKCWCVPGACTCIVIDDRVTRTRNAFDRDNAMLGKINFPQNLPF